jgi:hypothetical protein
VSYSSLFKERCGPLGLFRCPLAHIIR